MADLTTTSCYQGEDIALAVTFTGTDDISAWDDIAAALFTADVPRRQIGTNVAASDVNPDTKTWTHIFPSALTAQRPSQYVVEIARTTNGNRRMLAVVTLQIAPDGILTS